MPCQKEPGANFAAPYRITLPPEKTEWIKAEFGHIMGFVRADTITHPWPDFHTLSQVIICRSLLAHGEIDVIGLMRQFQKEKSCFLGPEFEFAFLNAAAFFYVSLS